MSAVKQIFDAMPDRFKPGSAANPMSCYFSVGDHKYVVAIGPDGCTVTPGKGQADVVLKCDPKLFEKIVLKGKMPGPLDIARGKFKTNDPGKLQTLLTCFNL
jgi:hypothetical protein